MPWLNTTTGIPASAAFFATGITASALDSVTAIPDTFASIAFCTRVACSGPFSLLEYCRVIPCAFAASCAPARILSQNVSPACSWVIIWMVRLAPDVSPPPPPPELGWLAGAPPWLLHAASAADAAATTARTRSVLRERSILIDHSSLQAAGRKADCGVLRYCPCWGRRVVRVGRDRPEGRVRAHLAAR